MSVFVITQRGPATLNSPVLDAGDGAEAVPVFTSRHAAEDYVRAAGWIETELVVELNSKAFLSWMLELHGGGVSHVAVDPGGEAAARSRPQPVLSVDRQLAALAHRLETHLRAPRKPAPPETVPVRLFRCRICGGEVEQRAGTSEPACCGTPMEGIPAELTIG